MRTIYYITDSIRYKLCPPTLIKLLYCSCAPCVHENISNFRVYSLHSLLASHTYHIMRQSMLSSWARKNHLQKFTLILIYTGANQDKLYVPYLNLIKQDRIKMIFFRTRWKCTPLNSCQNKSIYVSYSYPARRK